MVCTIFLSLLSKNVESGTVYVDDVVALWRTLESRFVHGKGEIWLEQFRQNHPFGVDTRYLELPEIGIIFVIDLHVFYRVAEIISSLEMASILPHILEDCCELSRLAYLVYEVVVKPLMTSQGLRVIDLHTYGLFDGLHATVIVAKIQQYFLISLDQVKISAFIGIQRMELFLSVLHLTTTWLGFHENIASPRYVPRQGESHSLSAVNHILVIFLCDSLTRSAEGYQHFSSIYVLNHGSFSFAYAPENSKSLMLTVILNATEDGEVGRQCNAFDIGCALQGLIEQTNSLLQPHLRCSFFCLLLRHRWWLLVKNPVSVGCHVLLQRQSRDFDFIGYMIVARFGWFGPVLQFFFGSLVRPPEDPPPKHMTLYVSKMYSILKGSIRLYISG